MDGSATYKHARKSCGSTTNGEVDLTAYFTDHFNALAAGVMERPVDMALRRFIGQLQKNAELQPIAETLKLVDSIRSMLIDDSVRSFSLTILSLFKAVSTSGLDALEADSLNHLEDAMRSEGYQLLSSAFPDIGPHQQGRLALQIEALHEALQRFLADREKLMTSGLVEDSWRLVTISALSEESHDRGRRPLLFQFDGGQAIVYKPRNLGMESSWLWVLECIAEEIDVSIRHQPVLLDCGSHGWMERVSHRPASSEVALQRYFRSFGVQLSLANALGIGDLHSENIIAVDDEPVIVDCEVFTALDLPWYDSGLSSHFATVLGTGLLPWTIVERGKPTLNRAGLATGPHITEQHWQGRVDGVGLLQPVRVDQVVVSAHSPFDGCSSPDWASLGRALETGFADGYRAFLRLCHQTAFRKRLRSRLRGQLVRVLPRTTNHYSQLLTALNSPASQRSDSARKRVLDKLRLAAPYCCGIDVLIPFERASLTQGDIPAFNARIGSRDLYWQAQRVVSNFFPAGSEVALDRRLDRLNETDLGRQRRLIRETFGQFRSPRMPRSGGRILGCLQTAQGLGELLVESNTSGYWFEAHHNGDHASLSRLDYSLEKGVLGLALLFAGLAARGEPRWEAHARPLLEASLTRPPAEMLRQGAGGHAGLGGQIFALCASARLLNDPGWLEHASSRLPLLSQALRDEQRMDLMAGCAGGLLAALELYRMTNDVAALECARLARSRLLDSRLNVAGGQAWPSCTEVDQRPLTGMAHGSSGIRMALARMQAVDPDARIPGVLEAVTRFEADRHDWQNGGAAGGQGEAWCRGTLGVALAWSEQHRTLGLPIPDHVTRALPGACQRYLSDNHSLCHGRLGNLLMIKRLSQSLPTLTLEPELSQAVDQLLDEINHGELLCGSMPRRELYGMMIGLAGIGYGLLVMDKPDWPDPMRLVVAA